MLRRMDCVVSLHDTQSTKVVKQWQQWAEWHKLVTMPGIVRRFGVKSKSGRILQCQTSNPFFLTQHAASWRGDSWKAGTVTLEMK